MAEQNAGANPGTTQPGGGGGGIPTSGLGQPGGRSPQQVTDPGHNQRTEQVLPGEQHRMEQQRVMDESTGRRDNLEVGTPSGDASTEPKFDKQAGSVWERLHAAFCHMHAKHCGVDIEHNADGTSTDYRAIMEQSALQLRQNGFNDQAAFSGVKQTQVKP